jgi:hypothetical protein
MTTQRLSKLQKWILTKALEDIPYGRNTTREFFGKRFSPSKKDKEFEWYKKDRLTEKEKETLLETKEIEKRQWNWEKQTWENNKVTITLPKDIFVSTKAEEVVISRSLKNLVSKGILEQPRKWGTYHLTQEGFVIANKCHDESTIVNEKGASAQSVNKSLPGETNVNKRSGVTPIVNIIPRPWKLLNYKEYLSKIEEYESKRSAFFKSYTPPSPEKQQKMFELKMFF